MEKGRCNCFIHPVPASPAKPPSGRQSASAHQATTQHGEYSILMMQRMDTENTNPGFSVLKVFKKSSSKRSKISDCIAVIGVTQAMLLGNNVKQVYMQFCYCGIISYNFVIVESYDTILLFWYHMIQFSYCSIFCYLMYLMILLFYCGIL